MQLDWSGFFFFFFAQHGMLRKVSRKVIFLGWVNYFSALFHWLGEGYFIVVGTGKECVVVLYWKFLVMGAYLHGLIW